VAATAVLLTATLITDPRDALIGLGLMVAGVPAYFSFRRGYAGSAAAPAAP
jgi:hypothetical protein